MGRRKINIKRIDNDRKRTVTFNKRKVGLIKKAIELSVLCDCEIAMVILKNDKVYQYASSDLDRILAIHRSYEGPIESLSNDAHEILKPGRSLPRRPEFQQSKKRAEPPTGDLNPREPKTIRPVAQAVLPLPPNVNSAGPPMPPRLGHVPHDFSSTVPPTAATAAPEFGFWTPDVHAHLHVPSDRFFVSEEDDSLRHTFDHVTRNVNINKKYVPMPTVATAILPNHSYPGTYSGAIPAVGHVSNVAVATPSQ